MFRTALSTLVASVLAALPATGQDLSLRLHDVDGDGLLDQVLFATDGGLVVQFNQGDGTFAVAPSGVRGRWGELPSSALGVAPSGSTMVAARFVGAGTLAPDTNLHVRGTARFEDPSNGRRVEVHGNGEIEAASDQTLYLNRFHPGIVRLADGGGTVAVGTGGVDVAGDLALDGVVHDSLRVQDQDNGRRIELLGNGEIETLDENTLSLNRFNANNVRIAAGGGLVTVGEGGLEVQGDAAKPGGGSWTVLSDARAKTNVQDLDGVLEQLLALRGVSFEYTDPAGFHELPGERIGLISQEVEQVFPDWVEEGDDGLKRLTVRGFEALVVESLRELRAEKDAQIETLTAQVAELQARLDD